MTSHINYLILSDLTAAERATLLRRTESDLGPFLEKVKPIIEAVRMEGDKALSRFAEQFDGALVDETPLPQPRKILTAPTPNWKQTSGKPSPSPPPTSANSTSCKNPKHHGARKSAPAFMPVTAPRPSPPSPATFRAARAPSRRTVLMTCIPASVAGVEDICIVTPPGPDGQIDAATLVAARAAGVSKVYKVGGAQAIAAVAYGTKTISRYVKVVGPGSPWVVAAKRLLADLIDTGTPAGPSEAIIFADETTDGRLAALDLLIEAEHGDDSSAFIVTTSKEVADAALAAIPTYWHRMSAQRVNFTKAVLASSRGGILLAKDTAEAMAFINDYAPEHLQILSKEPRKYLPLVKNAGEILLGEHTPSTLGNFVLGPSHVLPTGGWAKTFSALSVHDFMKRTSVVEVTPQAYPELAKHAGIIAKYEGFDAHANAVSDLRKKLLGN